MMQSKFKKKIIILNKCIVDVKINCVIKHEHKPIISFMIIIKNIKYDFFIGFMGLTRKISIDALLLLDKSL